MLFPLTIALVFAAAIGYLAQLTGLCMVRGVLDWTQGHKLRLIAILGTGFWIYLFFPLVQFNQAHVQVSYGFHWGFLAGGLIFGVGSAANGACSISTASRLASGDLGMLSTMLGWLLGWLAAEPTSIQFTYIELSGEKSSWFGLVIVACLMFGSAVVYWRYRRHWRVWGGTMLVGILLGALFLIQPAWSPSAFIRDLGLAIVRQDAGYLPAVDRIALLTMMLLGMGFGAWRYRHFRWVFPGLRDIIKHLASGTLMGLGAALALGGNDFQLLLAMPALSPGGISAVVGMLLGTWMGLILIRYVSRSRKSSVHLP